MGVGGWGGGGRRERSRATVVVQRTRAGRSLVLGSLAIATRRRTFCIFPSSSSAFSTIVRVRSRTARTFSSSCQSFAARSRSRAAVASGSSSASVVQFTVLSTTALVRSDFLRRSRCDAASAVTVRPTSRSLLSPGPVGLIGPWSIARSRATALAPPNALASRRSRGTGVEPGGSLCLLCTRIARGRIEDGSRRGDLESATRASVFFRARTLPGLCVCGLFPGLADGRPDRPERGADRGMFF